MSERDSAMSRNFWLKKSPPPVVILTGLTGLVNENTGRRDYKKIGLTKMICWMLRICQAKIIFSAKDASKI